MHRRIILKVSCFIWHLFKTFLVLFPEFSTRNFLSISGKNVRLKHTDLSCYDTADTLQLCASEFSVLTVFGLPNKGTRSVDIKKEITSYEV